MPLTDAEQAELNALVAAASSQRAKAEDPKTPAPLEAAMDQMDPGGKLNQPPKVDAKSQTEIPAGAPPSDAVPEKPGMMASVVHALGGGQPELTPEQQAQKAALPEVPVGSQDRVMLDALSRGWADHAIAKAKGTTLADERAATEIARLDAGDSASQFDFAGRVAPFFILGGGVGGLIRSAVTGGAMMLGDKVADTTGHEDRLPDSEEAVLSTVFGMGGGAVGSIIGKGLSGLYAKATHGKEVLPGFVRRATDRAAKEVDAAGKAMDASGLTVKSAYLNRLGKTVAKKVAGITPEGTPKAWAAYQRFQSGISRGEDLTIRQVNELRRGISEIKGKSFEQKYINDISGEINRFMTNLPGNPQAIAAGDAMQGIQGWQKMNQHFQDKLKLDKMAEKLALASNRAASGKSTFDKELQAEFGKWTTTKAGIREFENIFTKKEQQALLPLTKGTNTTRAFNQIDRMFAKGWLGTTLRAIRASLAHAPAGMQAKQEFGQAFGALPGGITPPATSAANVAADAARAGILGAVRPGDEPQQ